MEISRPSYYDEFHCIASRCPDSCCREWDVQVDEEAVRRFAQLPGSLGETLRRSLYEEEGEVYIGFSGNRCPMWREDGLCELQARFGEEALCRVCREFPRLHHDYGDFKELGLELSCPEAARILLTAQPGPMVTEEVPGGEAPGYDTGAMAVLRATRQEMLALLADPRPLGQVLALALLYGCHAQGLLDGNPVPAFDPEAALATAREMAVPGDLPGIAEIFLGLEILTPRWRHRLSHPEGAPLQEGCRNLMRYFVGRYWLQAVSDYDLYCRVKFMITACIVVSTLGGDFVDTAQLFSKEIENDADNMDALLDAAYDHEALTDSRLLGILLGY